VVSEYCFWSARAPTVGLSQVPPIERSLDLCLTAVDRCLSRRRTSAGLWMRAWRPDSMSCNRRDAAQVSGLRSMSCWIQKSPSGPTASMPNAKSWGLGGWHYQDIVSVLCKAADVLYSTWPWRVSLLPKSGWLRFKFPVIRISCQVFMDYCVFPLH
jgi:hypothetical protein